ncbi:hypothetical protein TURU_169256 [Turdus rufiventris]|nr:hypothetical protein TURU_169256 [Turdus rufiventris]
MEKRLEAAQPPALLRKSGERLQEAARPLLPLAQPRKVARGGGAAAAAAAAAEKRGEAVWPPLQESREKRCHHQPGGSRDAAWLHVLFLNPLQISSRPVSLSQLPTLADCMSSNIWMTSSSAFLFAATRCGAGEEEVIENQLMRADERTGSSLLSATLLDQLKPPVNLLT